MGALSRSTASCKAWLVAARLPEKLLRSLSMRHNGDVSRKRKTDHPALIARKLCAEKPAAPPTQYVDGRSDDEASP